MTESVILKEYEEKELNSCDLDKLHYYLECQKLDSALKITRVGVKARSWVGVIKYKKLQIQILPKLIYTEEYKTDYTEDKKNEVQANILKNLMFMLSYTKKLDIKTSNYSKLATSKNPFLEVLIRKYAKSLCDCLKRLTPKNYLRVEDNLNFIKGKIKFSENIRHNCSNMAKFYCEFDEYSEDNILNRLFLFVSTCLYNISNDSNNKKMLKFIMNYFSDIKFVRFDRFKADKIKLSKNQEMFKKPFNYAKMFIENSSVDLSKNRVENITLLWDMNKLFEEFICEIMKKYSAEYKYKIEQQRGRRLLIGDIGKRRNTYVDVLITKDDDTKIVLDTKYKKFNEIKDFSNADVFQVSTYCLLHNTDHAILLYPQWSDIKPDKTFYLNNDDYENKKYQIDFRTIDLRYDNIKDNLNNIKKSIAEILDIKK